VPLNDVECSIFHGVYRREDKKGQGYERGRTGNNAFKKLEEK
jgi:hypothetical protein